MGCRCSCNSDYERRDKIKVPIFILDQCFHFNSPYFNVDYLRRDHVMRDRPLKVDWLIVADLTLN